MEKVLFVDDSQNVLDGIRRLLRREPYEILTALSAREALEIMEKENIDAIVSDENMPGMGGSELLKICKEKYPETIRIVLTGAATVESAMSAIYEGWVYQYLHKPVKGADLAATLHNALILKSLKMDGESPHLIMSAKSQDRLLQRLSDADREEASEIAVREKKAHDEALAALEEIRKIVSEDGVSQNPVIAMERIRDKIPAE